MKVPNTQTLPTSSHHPSCKEKVNHLLSSKFLPTQPSQADGSSWDCVIPRLKMVLSFSNREKRAKSLFTPLPSALSFTRVLPRKRAPKNSHLHDRTFPKLPSAAYMILFDCTLPSRPLCGCSGRSVCLSSKSPG